MKFVYDKTSNKYGFISDFKFMADENLYVDATNVGALKLFAYKNGADYCQVRDCMKGIMQTTALSDLDKACSDFVLKHTNCLSAEAIIGFLMSENELEYAQAMAKYMDLRVNDIKSAAHCYSARIHSNEFALKLLTHLGQEQAEQFLFHARIPVSDLEQSAILGTQYGNFVSGIMDFIESTGDYTVLGLTQFASADSELSKKELKDILYYGYES